MNDSQTEQIMQIIRQEYEALDANGEIEIKPALVAARAQSKLDPKSLSPILMGWAAVLEFRQLARSVCRKVSCVDDPNDQGQSQLFDGQLQRRYPTVRDGEEQYVLREHLTAAERRRNAGRLRQEGLSKIKHGDALDAETDALIASGALIEVAAA